jgi:hypothetical protein
MVEMRLLFASLSFCKQLTSSFVAEGSPQLLADQCKVCGLDLESIFLYICGTCLSLPSKMFSFFFDHTLLQLLK